jgi:hypothetical protein
MKFAPNNLSPEKPGGVKGLCLENDFAWKTIGLWYLPKAPTITT